MTMQPGRVRGDAEVVSAGHAFLEAPRWHAGLVYASDVYGREVLCWDGARSLRRVCHVPGGPSGLGWTPGGELLVVSMEDRRLFRFDARHGPVVVADLSELAPWHLNDMVVDADGRAYVGNLGWDDETDDRIRPTVLVRVDADGRAEVVAEDLVNPNGMAIAPDGRTLLVNETFAARVTAFEIAPDGSLGSRRTWAAFADRAFETVGEAIASGAVLPDGIALDREGAAWLGDCRGDGAIRVVEGGEVLDAVSTGEHAAFAVALGGVDRRTLYLCTAPPYEPGGLGRGRDAALCKAWVPVPGAGRP